MNNYSWRIGVLCWRRWNYLLELLVGSPQVFIVVIGEVSGIITKGDLQKAPVRMWLFGVLSLLEMQFLRLIRASYPKDTWKELLKDDRLENAEEMLLKRKKRNEAIDLADCLQFCDKKTILLECDTLRNGLDFPSKNKGEELLKAFEDLRNELAHAQDIVTSRWPELVTLAKKAEDLLAACETLEPEAASLTS